MGLRKRYDGTRIEGLSPFRIINPYVMRGRNEAAIYYSQLLEIDGTHEFLREFNRDRPLEERVTLFHVLLAAAVRTVALRPQLNRFVSGRHIYQRNRIIFSFIVKKSLSDDGAETNAKVVFSPFDTLASVSERVREHVAQARDPAGNASDHEIRFVTRLPRFALGLIVRSFRLLDYYGIAPRGMIALDPLYATAYVANLGSVGLDAPYHHLFEWGNASVFFVIGRPRHVSVPVGAQRLENRLTLEVRYTFDDRVSEGYYAAKSLQMFRDLVQDPRRLVNPPHIPETILREHGLVEIPE